MSLESSGAEDYYAKLCMVNQWSGFESESLEGRRNATILKFKINFKIAITQYLPKGKIPVRGQMGGTRLGRWDVCSINGQLLARGLVGPIQVLTPLIGQ